VYSAAMAIGTQPLVQLRVIAVGVSVVCLMQPGAARTCRAGHGYGRYVARAHGAAAVGDRACLSGRDAGHAGPEQSARVAVGKLSGEELLAVLPLLQRVALVRSTRHALRRRRTVLPAVPSRCC
jgi:hypothetical protein